MTAAARRARIRADIPLLQQQPLCYLDNAATALMPAAVLAAAGGYDARNRGNIGRGLHPFAAAADAAYADARNRVAGRLNAAPEEVFFTPGCTAALNGLAQSLGETLGGGDVVLLSFAEHHSSIAPWQLAARRRGFQLRFFGIDERGAPDTAEAAQIARAESRVRGIVVSHRSNVSGAAADLPVLAQARAAGVWVLVDGAQAVPHALPDLPAMEADFYVFGGHKCYAPNGIGVLWGRRDALEALPPVIGGGGAVARVSQTEFRPAALPHRLEPGTPPISQAVGLAEALDWIAALPPQTAADVTALAGMLRSGLSRLRGLRLLFPVDTGDANPLVSFIAPHVHAHDLCEWLGERRVAVRGGHHCAQPLMEHLGVNACVRASIAPYNTEEDIQQLLDATAEALEVFA